MINEHIKLLSTVAEKRDEKLYAWLRWLVLLAAGFFSLMAGQLAGRSFEPTQFLLLKLAMALTAAGILAGATALYGEVSVQRRLAKDLGERIADILEETADESAGPIAARPTLLSRISERACYLSLAAALVVWVAFVAVST